MRMQLVPTSISIDLQDSIIRKAVEFADVEICGVVLKDNSIVYIPNVHPEPENFFQMSDESWLTLRDNHGVSGIKGIFHSHPSQGSFPSVTDQEALSAGSYLLPGWKYWIVTFAGVFEWEFNDLPAINA